MIIVGKPGFVVEKPRNKLVINIRVRNISTAGERTYIRHPDLRANIPITVE